MLSLLTTLGKNAKEALDAAACPNPAAAETPPSLRRLHHTGRPRVPGSVGTHRRTHPVARRLSHGLRRPAALAHGTLLQTIDFGSLWTHVTLRLPAPIPATRQRRTEYPQSQQNGLLQLSRRPCPQQFRGVCADDKSSCK